MSAYVDEEKNNPVILMTGIDPYPIEYQRGAYTTRLRSVRVTLLHFVYPERERDGETDRERKG